MSKLRLTGSTSGYVELAAPATAGDNTFTLPTGDGTSGQALTTDGAGALSWATVGVPDGDKGDITVSSSGSTWTIDNSVVTESKLASGAVTTDKIGNSIYTITTTSIDKTLVNRERCFVSASGRTITLPASPSTGWEVAISVGNFTNTVVARNGELIMGLAENMTIDRANVAVTLYYVDASNGWRIV